MHKIINNKQSKELEDYTIKKNNISSIDLIEKASKTFVNFFLKCIPNKNTFISIYSGTGNNGANGLAIGRLLFKKNYLNINIKIANFSKKRNTNFIKNLQSLSKIPIVIHNLQINKNFPEERASIIIDALLGKGLNRSLSKDYAFLVEYLNNLKKTVFSIEIPTGFKTEGIISKDLIILKAKKVISFQKIYINFLLPESEKYIKEWICLDIGLSKSFIKSLDTCYFFTEKKDISNLLIKRNLFQNKWNFGHALIIAGHKKTMGAALLCAKSCVNTGAGMTSACIPESGVSSLNTFSPEVTIISRKIQNKKLKINFKKFTSIAIGPGLGCNSTTISLFKDVIKKYKKPIIIDADGINLLSKNHKIWKYIPKNSILTPHVKEFDRLFGKHSFWCERLNTIKLITQEKKIFIILKNHYSILGTPRGEIFFNSTGNSYMAIGGMGDVLTGILASLLAQGYSSLKAAIIGLYLHGKCGDDLNNKNKFRIITPSMIIKQITKTLANLIKNK